MPQQRYNQIKSMSEVNLQAALDDPHTSKSMRKLLQAEAMRRRAAHYERALIAYRGRQNRQQNPVGTFGKASRWYPAEDERRPCCEGIRQPSKAHPDRLMLHCRTAEHVAMLFDIDARVLRALDREVKGDQ